MSRIPPGMPARLPLVGRHAAFTRQVYELQEGGYEELEQVVDDFCSLLALAQLESPAKRVPGTTVPVFAVRLDYPPFMTQGRNRFIVTYSRVEAPNPMRDADKIVLLSIKVAPEHLS